MKVVCTANSGAILPGAYLDPRAGYDTHTEFRLTVGKEYVVYALAFRDTQVWYYIVDDAELWYPVHHPAPLFDVIDDSLSGYWKYRFMPENLDYLALFTFEEWRSDPHFYERLTEHAEEEVSIFERIKSLMDSETPANAPNDTTKLS